MIWVTAEDVIADGQADTDILELWLQTHLYESSDSRSGNGSDR